MLRNLVIIIKWVFGQPESEGHVAPMHFLVAQGNRPQGVVNIWLITPRSIWYAYLSNQLSHFFDTHHITDHILYGVDYVNAEMKRPTTSETWWDFSYRLPHFQVLGKYGMGPVLVTPGETCIVQVRPGVRRYVSAWPQRHALLLSAVRWGSCRVAGPPWVPDESGDCM